MSKQPRALTHRPTPFKEKQYRDVAYLIEKAATHTQIAKRLRVDLTAAGKLVNEVIERWADRIGSESEMLMVRSAQLMGIARRCLIDFDKRQKEITITYNTCEVCVGLGWTEMKGDCENCVECDGRCECMVCEGTGEVKTERRVKSTGADLQLLVIAQRSIIEDAKLRGLYIQRKDTRSDQAGRMGGDLHQHVHIEGRKFENVSDELLEKTRKMLAELLDYSKGNNQVVEEGD